MKIMGLQKTTVLDYPGKVACTIFTAGCNFRCPFCHNASLVIRNDGEEINQDDIFTFLNKRKGILDGVCITGGEPLLQKDITQFIKRIKELGYEVKLDTNGSFPEKLKELVSNGLVDYVAMDIKNSQDNYYKTIGTDSVNFERIKESIDFLINGNIDYEFRTTLVNELHSFEDIKGICRLIKGAKNYYLQNFVDSGDLICKDMSELSKEEMEKMKEYAKKYINNVEIRGI